MYQQENEDDWKILKEYKQKRKNKLNNERKDFKKHQKKAQTEIPQVKAEINALLAKRGTGKLSRLEEHKTLAELDKKEQRLADLDDDIKKADKLYSEHTQEIDKLTKEIQQIDQKLKELRIKEQSKKKTKGKKGSKAPVQKCPKKCRIENIQIKCSHNRTLEVPPYEGELPTLQVVSGSDSTNEEPIEITFGGNCDYGKTQSAADAQKYKTKNRLTGNDKYCPRTKIQCSETQTYVERPTSVKFNAETTRSIISEQPVGFLFNRLVFGKDYDATEYDIAFSSCKGHLPYKAQVISFPKCSWNVEFSFGYQGEYDFNKLRRKFGHKKEKEYDGLKSSGKWASSIKAGFTYDSTTTEIEQELTFDDLMKELSGKWPLLKILKEFFEPINGFLEAAMGYSPEAEKRYNNNVSRSKKKGRLIHEGTVGEIDVKWPCLKLKGSYERAELANNTVGGVGSLGIEFSPLIGIVGKIDVIQFLLATVGGPFGVFLRKISNMSIGKRKDDGDLDKDGAYFETKLTLQIGAESSVSGTLGFDCTEEKGWHTSAAKTGIGGIVAFILEGTAAGEGKCWEIKFGIGAMFKTADETGTKNSGIEVSYKPTVVANEFVWAGAMEFNGLSVLWSTYKNWGIEGASGDNDKDKARKKFGKTKSKQENKVTRKHVFFTKRPLFAKDDAPKVGS